MMSTFACILEVEIMNNNIQSGSISYYYRLLFALHSVSFSQLAAGIQNTANLQITVHDPNSLFTGYKQKYIKAEEGLSHHYRICEFGGFDCLKKTSISDPTAAKWGPSLIPNIDEKCNQIFGNASCPPAPPLGSPW